MPKITFKGVNLELLRRERRRSPMATRQVAAGDMAEIQRAHCQILWDEVERDGAAGIVEVLRYLERHGSKE